MTWTKVVKSNVKLLPYVCLMCHVTDIIHLLAPSKISSNQLTFIFIIRINFQLIAFEQTPSLRNSYQIQTNFPFAFYSDILAFLFSIQ